LVVKIERFAFGPNREPGFWLLDFIAWPNNFLTSKVAQAAYRKIKAKLLFGNIRIQLRYSGVEKLRD